MEETMSDQQQLSRPFLYRSEDLGRIFIPPEFKRLISRPGSPTRLAINMREIGICEAVHKRPRRRDGVLEYEIGMVSITHNERVDAGAQEQAIQVFGGGGTPASPSTTIFPKVIAIGTSGFTTKTKTDQSIGVITSGVTTNEFTTIGLTRTAASARIGGDYTAPSTLGGTFAQLMKLTFTFTGGGTAHGSALFDSTTAVSSILYVEDIFSSDAIGVTNDTLTVTWTINN
jgi:hypothetical protein